VAGSGRTGLDGWAGLALLDWPKNENGQEAARSSGRHSTARRSGCSTGPGRTVATGLEWLGGSPVARDATGNALVKSLRRGDGARLQLSASSSSEGAE
jgi:hypothetical protein